MRTFVAALLGSVLVAGQAGKVTVPDTWTARTRPYHIIGNIHYVGTVDLASYLITTPAGHILIDTGLPQNADAVIDSIAALGFDIENVRLLLTTQAHFDHVGAHAAIARRSNASVVASAGDAPLLADGGRSDYHLGPRYHFSPLKVNRIVRDGDVVSLGDTSLTARVTPGHTQGTTTWTTTARDKAGRLRHVVFMGSTAVNEGVRLVDNDKYPQIASDFARSFRILKSLPCEVFLAAHGVSFDGPAKADAARAGQGENAFIDPEGCRDAVERSERAFTAELERQHKLRGGV
jgi:metallo-beta-lactamase class B